MSNLQVIERLCLILDEAQKIIREQAAHLEQHGIVTETGQLEAMRTDLLADIEKYA